MRRLLLTWLVAMVAIGVTPTPAGADAPRDQGWWTVTNPLPAPPDVPARGLLVQAGPDGSPIALAALVYELAPGESAGTLTLTVAPNSATTPATLQLCALLQPINHAEQGGPMSDAPPYNCGRKATAAQDANKDYKFDTSSLVADRLVAVAVLPNGPLDRVVLNEPDANSLVTTPVPPPAPPADAAPAAAAEPAPLPVQGFSTSPLVAAPSVAALPGIGTAGPSVAAPHAATPSAPSNAGGAFVPAVSRHPAKATPLLVLLLVAGTLGGAALWLYAGRQREGAAVSGPAPG